MVMDRNPSYPKRFTIEAMPWWVGAMGYVVYLLTVNHWIALRSLDAVNQVVGPVWQPAVTQPLTWAVLKLFRLLPASQAPLALNIFTAACAGGVLALLARTVVLLADNRTTLERLQGVGFTVPGGLTGWLPAALAAVACGLQLTFWERATAISGEMIDMLLFAWVVRCLFEFRAFGGEQWLMRAAFVFGLGMANDWGMVGFFPIFVAALLWLLRTNFFDRAFLWRSAKWLLAGLSLYLLLPVVHHFPGPARVGFWPALKANERYQAEMLRGFPRDTFGLLAMTSLLPVAVFAACRKADAEDAGGDNVLAILLNRISFRLAHVFFLGMSFWMALDLPLSPRKIGLGPPLLPCSFLPNYYLNAVVLGYCAGYLLRTEMRRLNAGWRLIARMKLIGRLGAVPVWMLVVALPVALAGRNLREIRWSNGPEVREFAEGLYADLPEGRTVALSADARQLILLDGALAAHGQVKDALLVDLAALPLPQYQYFMAQAWGARWPTATNGAATDLAAVTNLIARLAGREALVCLSPGFGYYQEGYVDLPKGLEHYLVARPLEDLGVGILDATTAVANEHFWEDEWTNVLQALAEQGKAKTNATSEFGRSMLGRAWLAREQNLTATSLRNIYSRALDDWGVELQRLGDWRQAGVWFERAVELRPDNLAAQINLWYNERYQWGEKARLNLHEAESRFREQYGKYPTWGRVILEGGPVDEPTFLNETARVLLFEGNFRQAAVDYARCEELAPDWMEPKLWFAQNLVAIHYWDKALVETEKIQQSKEAMDGSKVAQLMFCRVSALQGLGRTNEATECMNGFVRAHHGENVVLATAVELCVRDRRFEAALALLDELLLREPNNPEWLSNKAYAQMAMARRKEAIESLTTAIALAPRNQVLRLNRALVLLASGLLDAALGDYEEVLQTAPNARPVLFGLGEIAWRKKDTAAAIKFCEEYLASGVPQSYEYGLVSNRLWVLREQAGKGK